MERRGGRLAECEWEQIKPLFDGVKREKFNLARETIHFFEDREPELLADDERQYLKSLVERSAHEATEDDVDFYEAHRNELKEDRKLKSAWDRFVFGKPRETDDFLCGIALSHGVALQPGGGGGKAQASGALRPGDEEGTERAKRRCRPVLRPPLRRPEGPLRRPGVVERRPAL